MWQEFESEKLKYKAYFKQMYISFITYLLPFGGVSANLQDTCKRFSVILGPATSLRGTASDISLRSSLERLTLTEPALSSRFFILVVPTQVVHHKDQNNF